MSPTTKKPAAAPLPYEAAPTVLRGPGGLTLTLDVTQVFPDDPGNGTPAIVELDGCTATYDCAMGTGELVGRRGALMLSDGDMRWLSQQQRHVDEVWRQGQERDAIAKARAERRNADRIDGYDRDDLGESPDF
jgi:hypothetical protein